MKKIYEVMRAEIGTRNESEYTESTHDTLQEANKAAKALTYKMSEFGKNSKIKHTYLVYVAETITDEDGEWVSTDGAAGGYSATVEGIL